MKKPTGRYTETQRTVQRILEMEGAVKKENTKPVSVKEMISVLERFDKKIEVAMYLSKN